jgi:hypothetical protein
MFSPTTITSPNGRVGGPAEKEKEATPLEPPIRSRSSAEPPRSMIDQISDEVKLQLLGKLFTLLSAVSGVCGLNRPVVGREAFSSKAFCEKLSLGVRFRS